MAYRKELCTAGLLLLLSLLQTNQSASIAFTHTMPRLGKDALTHLEKVAASALKKHKGSHSVGCIMEPKEHECLNCTLIRAFSSYLQAASELDGLDELSSKLQAIRQHVEDLRNAKCSKHLTNICEVAFQKHEKTYKNLEKVRSILVLFLKWIVKPIENC